MRKLFLALIFSLLLPVVFVSCNEATYYEESIFTMDCPVSIKVKDNNDNEKNLVAESKNIINQVNSLLSETVETSDVFRFNESKTGIECDSLTSDMVCKALDLSKQTDGTFDFTIKSVSELWGIISDNPKIPDENLLKDKLQFVDYKLISIDGNNLKKSNENVKIDFGGIGKGYACNKVIEYLSDNSDGYGIVSFGSCIGVFGEKPNDEKWQVGITDPYNTSNLFGYVSIDSGYISVSGDYERFAEIDGKKYCHIFDPSTGYPIDNGIHSVVVYSDDACEADAVSTALMITGKNGIELLKSNGLEFECLIISDDEIYTTEKMKEMIYIYE